MNTSELVLAKVAPGLELMGEESAQLKLTRSAIATDYQKLREQLELFDSARRTILQRFNSNAAYLDANINSTRRKHFEAVLHEILDHLAKAEALRIKELEYQFLIICRNEVVQKDADSREQVEKFEKIARDVLDRKAEESEDDDDNT